jgi:predicted RNA-binding protein
MQTRRSWLLALTSGFVALGVLVVPTLAAEFFGRVKTIDVDAKKIVVTDQDSGKDVEVTIMDDTVVARVDGKTVKKFDLAKYKEKAEGKGRLKVIHEGGVASKLILGNPKKAQ